MDDKKCLTDCGNYAGAMEDLDSLVKAGLKQARFLAMNYRKEFDEAMREIDLWVVDLE